MGVAGLADTFFRELFSGLFRELRLKSSVICSRSRGESEPHRGR